MFTVADLLCHAVLHCTGYQAYYDFSVTDPKMMLRISGGDS
jgi:hypothetical protein